MNLLVSDYDGTLKSDIKNLHINIKALNKFIANGNKFCIATGRHYNSLINEIKKYNIPYDYLICNDGSIIFDKNNNILYRDLMKQDSLFDIIVFCNGSNKIKHLNLYDVYGLTTNLDNVLEVELVHKLFTKIDINSKDITKTKIFNSTFIKGPSTKSSSIKELLKIENLNPDHIYTVGDSKNDFLMLKDYEGHKMLYSYPILYGKNIKTCREVHSLIKKIEKRI